MTDQFTHIVIFSKWTVENSGLFKTWITQLPSPPHIIPIENYEIKLPEKVDLIITVDHYTEPQASTIIEAVQKQIPTLIIADGILEYRNTWYKPSIPPGSIFQPVLGHKIACLGRSQARFIESWGNLGKCEIVGSPRFDQLLDKKKRKRLSTEPFIILVMTAKTPGFTLNQINAVKASLLDLKVWFDEHPMINDIPIQPLWRITGNLADEVGVLSYLSDTSGQELAEILTQVDAVVTTPSTAMLEAMLLQIPVAILDYNNCPHYVPAAWSITAPQHIAQVICELLQPPAPRMLYQDTILHDSLECHSPAAPRMIQLIEEMIRIGKEYKEKDEPLEFPRRILNDNQDGHHLPEENFNMTKLFPNHSFFGEIDPAILQIKIGHLKSQNNTLIEHINNLNEHINNLNEHINNLNGHINNMEKSFFWKLRNKWFAIKRLLHLTREY